MTSTGDPTLCGLPPGIRACLFDLDGVLTKTASIHAAAWKEMFDQFLQDRATTTATTFVPFDLGADYLRYVDGKPRGDGVRSFLASRDITLDEGDPTDAAAQETIHGLGNRKNDLVQVRIERGEVEVFDDAREYVEAVRASGLARAVVSSSANTEAVLKVTGLDDLFDLVVDANVAAEEHLAGKPAPDTFLAAARRLGVTAEQSVVYEDALAGVAAGRAGRFGFVVGVDRVGQAEALRSAGADIVVRELVELLPR